MDALERREQTVKTQAVAVNIGVECQGTVSAKVTPTSDGPGGMLRRLAQGLVRRPIFIPPPSILHRLEACPTIRPLRPSPIHGTTLVDHHCE